MDQNSPEPPEEREFIFRPWITLPDGSRRYAKSYGKRAFRIPVTRTK